MPQNTTSHTPGPWVLGDPGSIYEGHIISTGNKPGRGTLVADMCGCIENETIAADARLIIAAPDLYAAADEALNVLIGCTVSAGGCDDAKHIQDAKTALRKAIAKAEGR